MNNTNSANPEILGIKIYPKEITSNKDGSWIIPIRFKRECFQDRPGVLWRARTAEVMKELKLVNVMNLSFGFVYLEPTCQTIVGSQHIRYDSVTGYSQILYATFKFA